MDSTREGEKSRSNPDVENYMAKEDTFIIGNSRPREDSSSKDLKHKKAQALAKANARHILKSWKNRHLNMDSDYLPSRPYVQHTGGTVQTTSGERIYFKWDENGKIMNPRQPKAVSKLYAYKRKRMTKKKANLGVLASKSAPNRELEYFSTNVKNDRKNTSSVVTNISLAERHENKIADGKANTGQKEMYFQEAQRHQTQKVKRVEFDLSQDRHLGVKEAFLSGSARTKAGNSSMNTRNNVTKYINSETEFHKTQPADSYTSIPSPDCLADSDKENANTFTPSAGPVTCLSNKGENDINIPGSNSQRLPKEHKRRRSTNELGESHLSFPQKQTSFARKKELVIDRTGKTEQKCSKPHPPFPKSNLHAKSSDILGPVKQSNGDENGVETHNGYALKTIPRSTKEKSLSENNPSSTNKTTTRLPEGALHTSEDKSTETLMSQSIDANACSFRNVSADHQIGKTQTSAAQAVAVAMQGNVKGNGDVLEKMTPKQHLHGHASSSSSVSTEKDNDMLVTSTANVTNSLLRDRNTVNEKESGKRVEYRGHLQTIVEGCAEPIEQSVNDSSQSQDSVLTESMASNEALNNSNRPALCQVKEGLLSNTVPTKNKPRSFMETEVSENRLSVSWPKTHMPRTNIEQELVTGSVRKNTSPNRLDLFGVDHVSGTDSQPLSINRCTDKYNTDMSQFHAFDSIGKSSLFPEKESIIGTAGNAVDEHRMMHSANEGQVSSVLLENQPKDWPVSLDVSSASQYPDFKEERLCVNENQDTDHDLSPTSGRPLSACPSRQLGLPLHWTDEGDGAQDDDLKFINDENDFYEVFGYDAETTELLRATRIFPVDNFQSEQETNSHPYCYCISEPGKKVAESNSDISGERPRVSGLIVQRDIKTKRNLGESSLNAPEQCKNISVRDDMMQFKYSSKTSDPEYKKVKARKRTVSFASRIQSDESLYGNVHLLSKNSPKHHSKYSTQSVVATMSTSSSSSLLSSYASQMISPPIFPTRKGESHNAQLKGPSESNTNIVISMAKGKNYQTWRKISQGNDSDIERQLPNNKMNLERAPRPPPLLQSSPGGRKTPQKVTECQQIPLQLRKMHGDTDADFKKGVTLNCFPEPMSFDSRSLTTVPHKNTKPVSRKIRQTEVYLNPSVNHSFQTAQGPEHKPNTFAGHGQKLKRLEDDDHTLATMNVNLVPGSYNDAADRIRSRILEQNPGTIIRDNSLLYKNGRKPSQPPTACSNATETKGQSNVKHSVRDKEQNAYSPISTQLSDHSSLIKPRKLKPIIHHPGMHKRHQHLASGL